MTWLFTQIVVHVPEQFVDVIVDLVFALGGWSDPQDSCECVYLPMMKFILEV